MKRFILITTLLLLFFNKINAQQYYYCTATGKTIGEKSGYILTKVETLNGSRNEVLRLFCDSLKYHHKLYVYTFKDLDCKIHVFDSRQKAEENRKYNILKHGMDYDIVYDDWFTSKKPLRPKIYFYLVAEKINGSRLNVSDIFITRVQALDCDKRKIKSAATNIFNDYIQEKSGYGNRDRDLYAKFRYHVDIRVPMFETSAEANADRNKYIRIFSKGTHLVRDNSLTFNCTGYLKDHSRSSQKRYGNRRSYRNNRYGSNRNRNTSRKRRRNREYYDYGRNRNRYNRNKKRHKRYH